MPRKSNNNCSAKETKDTNEPHFHEYHARHSELSYHGGLRFAINLMHQAVKNRKRIILPHEEVEKPNDPNKGYTDKKLNDGWRKHGWRAVYEYDAAQYRRILGDATVKKLLLSVEDVQQELPKDIKATTLTDFFS